MKIRSIRIESFGKFRDLSVTDLPDGLTIVSGNNESGKTTLMEFMRSTMFPSTKRSLYPLPSVSDRGSVELETDSGEKLILLREQKKVSEFSGKGLPGQIFSMDPETYSSIFAMDLADLTDAGAISSERIRSRFLTIPGGERVPGVVKDINSSKTGIMNDDRITDRNPVGALKSEISRLDAEISLIIGRGLEYDRCAEEAEVLKHDIGDAMVIQTATEKERERRNLLESHRDNVKAIYDLEAERKELEYAVTLTDETISRYDALESNVAYLKEEIEEVGDPDPYPDDRISKIKNMHREISDLLNEGGKIEDRIESLKDEIAENEERMEEIGVSAKGASPEAIAELIRISRGKAPVIPMMLFLIAAAVFAAAYNFNVTEAYIAGAASAALGLILLLLGKKNKAVDKWMGSYGYPSIDMSRLPLFVAKLEKVFEIDENIKKDTSELNSINERIGNIHTRAGFLLKAEGSEFTDLESAEDELGEMISYHETEARKADRVSEMTRMAASNEKELDTIGGIYGGREQFIKAKADRSALLEIDSKIKTIKESVESATGTDLHSAIAEMNSIRADGPDMKDEIAKMNERMGELNAGIKEMRSDERLGRLSAERNAKRTELEQRVKEWGVLSLQGTMIDRSCMELYSKMQPSVIRTANKYLGMMTHWRYKIDPDPRREEIVIFDAMEHKTSKQWSSGLGDQVYLAIKMAVAKEMGAERLPVILDDVLVRFDPGRRRSACEMILEFAKDQQVFLFSCVPIESYFPEGSFRHVSL